MKMRSDCSRTECAAMTLGEAERGMSPDARNPLPLPLKTILRKFERANTSTDIWGTAMDGKKHPDVLARTFAGDLRDGVGDSLISQNFSVFEFELLK